MVFSCVRKKKCLTLFCLIFLFQKNGSETSRIIVSVYISAVQREPSQTLFYFFPFLKSFLVLTPALKTMFRNKQKIIQIYSQLFVGWLFRNVIFGAGVEVKNWRNKEINRSKFRKILLGLYKYMNAKTISSLFLFRKFLH